VEEDFLLLLKKSRDLVALVGNRISLDIRPQDSDEPAIVVSRVSGGHEHDLYGSVGFARPVMHVMCFASRAILANQLRDKVRMALQGFSGVVGKTNFGAVILDEEDHDYQPPIDANDLTGTFARLLVFTVLHGEQIPTFS
jgi:hypothetical protein